MSALDLENKTLFVHVPKTGGCSMEQDNQLGTVITTHYGMDHYVKFAAFTDINLKNFFKFGFVREPYERVASAILNHPMKGMPDAREKFNDFILKHEHMLDRWVATKPMHTFLCIGDEIVVDFVGRFENIEEDWKKACEGMGRNLDLPHINKGGHDSYEGLYNDEARALVREIYEKDFELFDYTP